MKRKSKASLYLPWPDGMQHAGTGPPSGQCSIGLRLVIDREAPLPPRRRSGLTAGPTERRGRCTVIRPEAWRWPVSQRACERDT